MKKTIQLIIALAAIALVSIFWKYLWDYEKYHEWTKPAVILKQFNKLNQTHEQLTKKIKASVPDTNAFKILATTYSDNGQYLVVTETYEYTDKAGRKIYASKTAEFTYEGEELIEKKPEP